MKTRIVTGLVGTALLIGVLLLPPIVLYGALSLICALAIYEMFTVTGLRQNVPMLAAAAAFALASPFFGWTESVLLFCVALAVLLLILVAVQIVRYESQPLEKTGLAFFLTVVLSVGISCTAYCRTLNENGLFYFLLALFIAWGSDTGAYFIGTFFGKHQLCPHISPKKTVEGFAGGWIFSVLASLGLAFVWESCTGAAAVYWQVALVAFLLSPLSVAGDLFASVIKRQGGAKDYGNIMPGHGGIMDRFDSLLFVAPLLYALLHVVTLFA